MQTAATRACLGFTAGAIGVLTFHQGLAEVFYLLGLPTLGGYRTAPTWPFGIPVIVSLCFWGGFYGALFGAFMPRIPSSLWRQGLVLGLAAGLIGLFVVAPIKGHGVAWHWMAWPIARTLLLNGCWGLGVGLILPLLRPRPLTKPDSAMQAVNA